MGVGWFVCLFACFCKSSIEDSFYGRKEKYIRSVV